MPAQKRGWQDFPFNFDNRHASSHHPKVSPLLNQFYPGGSPPQIWVVKPPPPKRSPRKAKNIPPTSPKLDFAPWVLELLEKKKQRLETAPPPQTSPKLPSQSEFTELVLEREKQIAAHPRLLSDSELHTIEKGNPASPISHEKNSYGEQQHSSFDNPQGSDGDMVEASSCTEMENPSTGSDTSTPRSDICPVITPKPAGAKAFITESSIIFNKPVPRPRGSVGQLAREEGTVTLEVPTLEVPAEWGVDKKVGAVMKQLLKCVETSESEERRHPKAAAAAADTPAAADSAASAVADVNLATVAAALRKAAAAADAAAAEAAGQRSTPAPGINDDVKELQLSFCLCLGLNKKHICTQENYFRSISTPWIFYQEGCV